MTYARSRKSAELVLAPKPLSGIASSRRPDRSSGVAGITAEKPGIGWPGNGGVTPLTGVAGSWVPETGPGWYAVAGMNARASSRAVGRRSGSGGAAPAGAAASTGSVANERVSRIRRTRTRTSTGRAGWASADRNPRSPTAAGPPANNRQTPGGGVPPADVWGASRRRVGYLLASRRAPPEDAWGASRHREAPHRQIPGVTTCRVAGSPAGR